MNNLPLVKKRIVIVDDLPENIQLIGKILREKGFLISVAQSGKQALTVIEQNIPDLILLDIIMPDMDGFETCRCLKQNPATKDIPVIFLTAVTDSTNKVEGFNLGAVDYITKPIDSDELVARINTHLTIKYLYEELAQANAKLAEKVRSSESKFKTILSSMADFVFQFDKDGRYIFFHSPDNDLLYVPPDQFMGKKVAEVMPSHINKLFVEAQEKNRQGKSCEIEYQLEVKGKISWFSAKLSPIFHNNEFNGSLAVVRDITQQKKIQEMMIQSEKMISIGNLAAGMAHELNNPLGGILQSLQNIERRLSLDMPKNVQQANEIGINLESVRCYLEKRDIINFITGARKAGIRASNIIANMLKFSRKSESKMLLTNIHDLINRTIDIAISDYSLSKGYDFRRIKITREFEPDLPMIMLSPSEIEQVILNIILNACQAMIESKTNSPHIIISTQNYTDNIISITIEDNGPGMNEEVRKKIFEPFFTTKEIGVGTGLGLAVAYMIITNNHKGSIRVESLPGKGSKFIINFNK